jgi:hypothetical protein
MVRRSRSILLPEPASLTNPRPHRYAAPATLRVAMRAGEALRAGLKICERCRLVSCLQNMCMFRPTMAGDPF